MRIQDIDSSRYEIVVRRGTGAKDLITKRADPLIAGSPTQLPNGSGKGLFSRRAAGIACRVV